MDIVTERYSRPEAKSYYDEFYESGDFKAHRRGDAALVAALRDRYDIAEGARVLDVPCGTGKFSRHWHEQGCDVFGVDISKRGIAVADESRPSCEFSVGDALNMPVEDDAFDVVFCHGFSLFNTTDFEQTRPFVRHAIEKLHPGGIFVWGKTSTMRDGPNKRETRIDFSRERLVSFFESIDTASYLETRSVVPHVLPALEARAFSRIVSRPLQLASRLSGLPVRTYVVLEKPA